jgi:hypothetical protein
MLYIHNLHTKQHCKLSLIPLSLVFTKGRYSVQLRLLTDRTLFLSKKHKIHYTIGAGTVYAPSPNTHEFTSIFKGGCAAQSLVFC